MKKIELLEKAKKVNYVFDKMDKETQEAVKSLINHLMVAKIMVCVVLSQVLILRLQVMKVYVYIK